jgi:Large extracellular alpha-helical protein
VLDTLLVPVKGNAGRVEVPIKENYAPNATVSIYLVKPGGENELPLERFAYSEIDVRRPDRELKVAPHLATNTAKPGDAVRGEVLVTSQDKPVADARSTRVRSRRRRSYPGRLETAGHWCPLLPQEWLLVRTYEALHGYIENLAKLSLTQKGFVIGDGGEETISNIKNVRKEFRTLAFWQGSLKLALTVRSRSNSSRQIT